MDSTTVINLISALILSLIVNGAGLLSIRNARMKDKADLIVKLAAIEAEKIKDKALAVASNLELESRLTDQVLERATKENARLSLRVITLENAVTVERDARHKSEDAQEEIRNKIAVLQDESRERSAGFSTIEASLIAANLSIANLTSEVASLKTEVIALKAALIVKDTRIAELEGDTQAATP